MTMLYWKNREGDRLPRCTAIPAKRPLRSTYYLHNNGKK